jgi:ribose transport system permease protein
VSILGILGVAMALAVIGRGIDLSLVAVMAISVAWTLQLVADGTPLPQAVALGLAFSLITGMINGVLIAYVEIPAIFATLAMGTAVYGFGRYFLFGLDVIYLPPGASGLAWLGQGTLFDVPVPIYLFAAVCLGAYLFLRYTKSGRYLRAVGDNLLAARITGVPVRPVIVLQYMLCSLIGFVAGIVTAASVASMNTRVANSTLVYDVILVVVLGGIGLSGGRGGIRNVLVGTLLIGVLLNGMTIMDIQYTVQNVIKGVILLTAIVIDTILNPRDEQTAQQGDI